MQVTDSMTQVTDSMTQVTDKTLGSWTRTRNDASTCDYGASKNEEMFKFMSYSPEYLVAGSCVAGNTQNCSVFQTPDLGSEPRIGWLTNLNAIQRSTTNDKALGMMTSPDFSTGPLVDPRLIQDMSTLESKYQHTTRLDMPSSSQVDTHYTDRSVFNTFATPEMPPRMAERVSSRVVRRNVFAERCKR